MQLHQVNKAYPTALLQLIPTPIENLDTSESSIHSRAWSTSLVTNQGTHEFLQELAEALISRYDTRFLLFLPFPLFFEVACYKLLSHLR